MCMTKLSFIVPVYNVAPYLRKCVDSLLSQDYVDYEIILVDDGSTDESGVICDDYLNHKFESCNHKPIPIRVIHQTNAGLSAARNAGVKAATGDYICFVDSDDYWEENVLGALMAQVERDKLDVLRFDYQNVRLTADNQYEVYLPNKYPHQVDTQVGVVTGEQYLNERMCYACYAVMFIMRRDIVPMFTPGIHFEDVDWMPRMLIKAQRVNSTIRVVYNYLIRQGSITKTLGDKGKIQKNIEDKLTIIRNYRGYLDKYPNCTWIKNMQSGMACDVLNTIAREFYKERKKYIDTLKEIDVFPLAMANQGRTYSRRARIINLLGPHIYCFIKHL